nr:MarR family winged helix-turn-helix transcriptional regulator [uncultured Holophaga sp.]
MAERWTTGRKVMDDVETQEPVGPVSRSVSQSYGKDVMPSYDIFESFEFHLNRAAIASSAALTRCLAPFDLTPVQWALLAGLKRNGDSTPTDLVSFLDRDLPATVRLIWKLEDRGLLRRKKNPVDARSYIVSLTPSGHTLLRKLAPRVSRIREAAGEQLPQEELRQLLEAIKGLRSAYAGVFEEEYPTASRRGSSQHN